MSNDRINHDGRVFGKDGEPDYFIPDGYTPKLLFVIFAFVFFGMGLWLLWDPAIRLFYGETEEARVSKIIRKEAGMDDQIIRTRREIKPEESNFSLFYEHYVEVPMKDGTTKEFRMGVDARTEPHNNVNDTFEVIFFPDDDVAYGLYHHRTWAFGLGFLFMSVTFIPLSLTLLFMVGKPIYIDPEDPELLEKEKELQKQEEEYKLAQAQRQQKFS